MQISADNVDRHQVIITCDCIKYCEHTYHHQKSLQQPLRPAEGRQ